MAEPQKETFWSEFIPALLAGEADRILALLFRRSNRTSGSSTSARTPARGDVDDAYFSLKDNASPTKQQTIWAWIQNLKRTTDGQAKIRRLERDKNTPRIKTMFEQGTPEEWDASIPKSWQEQLGALLPTLDAETQAQIHKTFGGAARRQTRRATPRSRKKLAIQIILCVIINIFILMVSFPDFMPYGHALINLLKNLFQ